MKKRRAREVKKSIIRRIETPIKIYTDRARQLQANGQKCEMKTSGFPGFFFWATNTLLAFRETEKRTPQIVK